MIAAQKARPAYTGHQSWLKSATRRPRRAKALSREGFASSTLINAKCENISCCTSVAAVRPSSAERAASYGKG